MESLKIKRKNLKLVALALIIFTLLVSDPLLVQAFSLSELFDEIEEWFSGKSNEVQIINEVNVSANTGNTVINEEVKEGETKSKVYVKNIINGEEIDPIDIESEANEVKVESEIKVEEGKALVQRGIEIDSEKESETYEVDLEDSETEIETENEGLLNGTLDSFQEWWSDFIENLNSFFQNIFNF